MRHEIVPKHSSVPSFDEFKRQVLETGAMDSLVDKTASIYELLPPLLQILHNFDPTGAASAIDQVLSDAKAQRDQENILRAIYSLAQALERLGSKLLALDNAYLQQNVPPLTYAYFEYSERALEPNKIDLFRNTWLNGLLSTEKPIGEKSAMFGVVETLSMDEILTLRYIHDTLAITTNEDTPALHVDDIADALEFDAAYVGQICLRLQGLGLLFDFGIGKYGYQGPVRFSITEYMRLLVQYISEPSSE